MTPRPSQLLSLLLVLLGVAALGAERSPAKPANAPVGVAPESSTLPTAAAPVRTVAAVSRSADQDDAPTVRRQWMEVTAYCPCTRCCGEDAAGVTASGLPVTHNNGRFVAADTTVLPMGARVSIPGYHQGRTVPVIDRGGAIKGSRIDLFFPSHDEALQWGRRWVLIDILPD